MKGDSVGLQNVYGPWKSTGFGTLCRREDRVEEDVVASNGT